jgi:hypothetical protein
MPDRTRSYASRGTRLRAAADPVGVRRRPTQSDRDEHQRTLERLGRLVVALPNAFTQHRMFVLLSAS